MSRQVLCQELTLKCPEKACGGRLVRGWSKKYGRYEYRCDVTRCSGYIGAHPDGSPLGKPANKATRQARIRAHEVFDRLWSRVTPVRITRTAAYRWLAQAMGKTEVHIAEMDAAECERVVQLVSERLK